MTMAQRCVIISGLLTACTSGYSNYSSKSQSPTAQKNTGTTIGEEAATATSAAAPVAKANTVGDQVAKSAATVTSASEGQLTAAQKIQECWFAVSGTYVGYGDYSDTFGQKIAPGEIFDTVGGVFLAARAEPYIYGQGQKEIDGAVNYTFDGIVVPQGMSVEIRPSANGEIIHKGQGPLIAITGTPSASGKPSSDVFKAQFESGALRRWPQWMQDYLKETGGLVHTFQLHPARWVKVSVVDGGRCSDL